MARSSSAPALAPAPSLSPFTFPYYSIRKISCPEDEKNNRTVYAGYAPFTSYLALPNDQNVRDFLLDAEGKEKKQPTQVHLAIRETLENNPDDFSVLNSGIVIVAPSVAVDDAKKVAVLLTPSIINGAQTQGLLREYQRRKQKAGQEPYPIHVAFQLIVTEDPSLVAEISIARNFQNDVMTISIAGRKRQLDELEEAFQRHFPDAKLRKSETKLSEDYVLTEKLLQVITALVPAELWPHETDSGIPVKTFTYAMKTRCLKLFQRLWEANHDDGQPPTGQEKELYQFFLDVAGPAWELYQKWQTHPGFKGTALRAIERDEKGNVTQVPDGIIFPIIASLSNFATKKNNGRWKVAPPDLDADLIAAAKTAYQQIASSNPSTMGKSKPCYSQLHQIASLYRRLMTPAN